MEKAVVDAQVLFYFHYDYNKIPTLLQNLKKRVIKGQVTIIIPVIAIAELFWKMRKKNKIKQIEEAIQRWEISENIIIDDFDLNTIKLMFENKESHELHDEIIAMSCKKHKTNVIYSTDKKFRDIFGLELRTWK
ncbi:MAG: type II toxin-antitoxin system VapC family toxin [Promethearchaeota archaeon]